MANSKQFEQMKDFVLRGVNTQREVDRIIEEHTLKEKKVWPPEVVIKIAKDAQSERR